MQSVKIAYVLHVMNVLNESEKKIKRHVASSIFVASLISLHVIQEYEY